MRKLSNFCRTWIYISVCSKVYVSWRRMRPTNTRSWRSHVLWVASSGTSAPANNLPMRTFDAYDTWNKVSVWYIQVGYRICGRNHKVWRCKGAMITLMCCCLLTSWLPCDRPQSFIYAFQFATLIKRALSTFIWLCARIRAPFNGFSASYLRAQISQLAR